MVTKKTHPRARIFAVKGKVESGDEIVLHDVLTWPVMSDAEAFCAAGKSGISKRVVIAERGASFEGGMTMRIGSREVWPVKLENDRALRPLGEGQVLSVLESEWVKIKGTQLWEVRANIIGHFQVAPEGVRFVARRLSA